MVKTRFAPSPTGFLHVGGARTALYSWLFARKNGGRFVLRIEDTDQVRSTAESARGILEDMQWLGLNWDEGPVAGGEKNEFFQSTRLEIYNKYMNELLAKGVAYEAYESKAQLDGMRKAAEAAKRPFRYRRDMAGRVMAAQEGVGEGGAVVRFAMPREDITHHDLILGDVTVKAVEHDDIVIRKADGFPTYHFAVVVDDHLMGVTHVLRAQEHLMNTFKHIGLYRALGWEVPAHGHLPLVFNMDATKMSKREKAKVARAAMQAAYPPPGKDYAEAAGKAGLDVKVVQEFMAKKSDAVEVAVQLAAVVGAKLPEIDVQDFRRSGYLPEALVNFIALVGWSPGGDREFMTREEMVEMFGLEGIQKTSGKFDRKKLAWMNGEYIRRATVERLVEAMASFNAVTNFPIKRADEGTLRAIIGMYKERMATLAEMAEGSRFFFAEPAYDEKAVAKFVRTGNGVANLKEIKGILEAVGEAEWTMEGLTEPFERILAVGVDAGEKRGAASQALRVAVSGSAVSPPLTESIVLLGKAVTMRRIEGLLRRVQGE